MKKNDWIGLIEAGYNLEGNDESWAATILATAIPLFNRGWWPSIQTFHYTPTTLHLDHLVTRGPSLARKAQQEMSNALPQETIDLLYRSGNLVGSLSELVYDRFPQQQPAYRRLTQGKIGDALGVTAHSGEGNGLVLLWGFLRRTTATALERKRWALMGSHLGAGLRLRTATESLTLDTEPVEAIFDAGGKLHEARLEATEPSARQALRDAVRRIDHLRTRAGRKDPDVAMQAWEGLVEGRWSLVDHFDSDQRRFVVAIKNDPEYPDPRGLTMRERQVSEFVGLGQSAKAISYTLGLSSSAITNCTARAQQKLGLSSLTELATFFAPAGLRTKLAEVSVQGEELLVGAYPLVNERWVSMLTDTEQKVLTHLVAGSTNSDIAQRQDTSEHTVAKHVQNIFRKLEVCSRSELAARLQNVG